MSDILKFMGDHPILTVILAMIVCATALAAINEIADACKKR